MIKWVAIKLIRGYQILISPLIGSNCRFYPSCSAYMIEAMERFGFFKGLYLGLKRLGNVTLCMKVEWILCLKRSVPSTNVSNKKLTLRRHLQLKLAGNKYSLCTVINTQLFKDGSNMRFNSRF